MQLVMNTYPPSEYPKLYGSSIENYIKFQKKYVIMNNILIIIGLVLLTAFVIWESFTVDRDISQMIPWSYFMVQMIPYIWLEISEYKSLKIMRKNNTNKTKKADIRPRKLFDFITFRLLLIALAALFLGLCLVLFRYGFSSKLIENFIAIGISNLFFVVVIYWQIYGKKIDPYQSSEDRLKVIKATIVSMVYMSIAVNVFISVQMLVNMYDLDFLEKSIMSIYAQLIVWAGLVSKLNQLKIENINFDVYKNNDDELNNSKNDAIIPS
jgi:hypothetical protein